MELSNSNCLDIGAEDHFMKFLIQCTLGTDIAESECGKKTRWWKKWGNNYILVPSNAIGGGAVPLVAPRVDSLVINEHVSYVCICHPLERKKGITRNCSKSLQLTNQYHTTYCGSPNPNGCRIKHTFSFRQCSWLKKKLL